MSTGEVINANGAPLTAEMIRGGFNKFPQSDVVLVPPSLWALIAPLEIAADYPFTANEDDTVPAGELWYIGPSAAQVQSDPSPDTAILGRIINIGS